MDYWLDQPNINVSMFGVEVIELFIHFVLHFTVVVFKIYIYLSAPTVVSDVRVW